MVLQVIPAIAIPDWELSETFIRASGPGGQLKSASVKKRASAARRKAVQQPACRAVSLSL